MENVVGVKADNVEIPCAGIAVGNGAVAHDETVGNAAVAASARIVEAAGIRAADGVVFFNKLIEIKPVVVRAVGVERADDDLRRIADDHELSFERRTLDVHDLHPLAALAGVL